MGADEEILQEFLVEGRENLDRLERELVGFEANGASEDSISAIFRTVHTVKGTAGFFGFDRLQSLTHVAESLLSKIRDRELALTSGIVSAQLAVVDACRMMLDWVEQTGTDGNDDYAPLKTQLEWLAAPTSLPVLAQTATAAPPAMESERADTTVRVDVQLLDKLMDLAGELVLARNQLLELASTSRDAGLAQSAQRLDLITSELQDHVMKTRMQPIGGVWNKLPRVVRDLSAELGKQVRLELEGKDTGLDRSVLEAIKDPLTHIIRNSIDHGIETPSERIAKGKDAEGALRLRAIHAGGHVLLEIADDGAGIDPDRVRAKAIERGIVSPERAAKLTTEEAQALVFAPGFSTAEKITNVSGRGVGMDVVKTNIEGIGGAVEIDSVPGRGTTIRLKIPLTLAIIPALLVVAAGERYALPQSGVLELVRIDPAAGRKVELIDHTPVYRLRGELLPLVYLSQLLGTGGATATTIVVLQNEGRPFGLVVDTAQDTEEIVAKPIGKRLIDLATYSGATILGDGRVALILDVRGIAMHAGLGSLKRREADVPRAVIPVADRYLLARLGADRRIAVSLEHVARLEELSTATIERAAGREVVQYRDGLLPLIRLGDALGAMPSEPDKSGEGPARSAAEDGAKENDRIHVIVYSSGDRDLGLVVDGILDVIEERAALSTKGAHHGLLGSAVLDGKVTDVVDVAAIAASAGYATGGM
ncbi:MAG: chemotaxis protein CheA [Deltaproteobacteria bacterium]